MHWETKREPGYHGRYIITLYEQGKYDSKECPQASMKYESWLLGGCSTAGLWGFSQFSAPWCKPEYLVGLIEQIRGICGLETYNPRMVLCQVPAAGTIGRYGYPEVPFFKLFRETIYPEVKPIFTYPNRSHESTMQRLYYFDTDVMYAWLEK